MNRFQLYRTPKENIFEWRIRDYKKYKSVIRDIASQFRYISVTFTGKEYHVQDICKDKTEEVIIEYDYVNRKGEHKHEVESFGFPYPVKYNVVGFKFKNVIRFPIFQIIDDMYYCNKYNFINIVSNMLKYPARLVCIDRSEDNWVFEQNKKTIPIALLMLLKYNSIDEYLKDFKIKDYEIVNILDEESYQHIRLSVNSYLVIKEYESERHLNLLKHLTEMERVNSSVNNFSTYKIEALSNYLTSKSLPVQFFEVFIASVMLKDPYTNMSILDIIRNLIVSGMLFEITPRKMNDLGGKRFRLMESFLKKIYSGYVTNIIGASTEEINTKFINSKTINGELLGPLVQFDNSVNPAGQLAIQVRSTYLGPGGFKDDNVSLELRNLDKSYYGILDPVDTPSGLRSGVVNYIVPEISLDEIGRHPNNIHVII